MIESVKNNAIKQKRMLEYFKQMRDAWTTLEKAQADAREAQLLIDKVFQGVISDLSLLPQLYAWYRDVADRKRFSSDIRNGNHKQFVFVVLMLYSPMSLYGGKIGSNLRREIAGLLHLRSHTILYYMRDKAVAWNSTYKTFSSEVEAAYEALMVRLREQGEVE